jgi:hypothetical protein
MVIVKLFQQPAKPEAATTACPRRPVLEEIEKSGFLEKRCERLR